MLLVSGLSANAYVLPAPVLAPVRASFPTMGFVVGESQYDGHYDALRTRDNNPDIPDVGIRASVLGPNHVGVENTWRPHDGKHEGHGQPMIAGLSKQAVMEKSEMAAKKNKIYGPASKSDGIDTWPGANIPAKHGGW